MKLTYKDILRDSAFNSLSGVETFSLFVDYMFYAVMGCGDTYKSHLLQRSMEERDWEAKSKVLTRAIIALGEDMTRYPFMDILGDYHMELGAPREQQRTGEFYTPKSISTLLTALTCSDAEEGKLLTLHEPTCGSGANILAFAEKHQSKRHLIRAHGMDINLQACKICIINTTLYSIPAVVVHGNTLTMETWATFKNPPLVYLENGGSIFCQKEENADGENTQIAESEKPARMRNRN